MSTTGIESWAVDLANVGAVYPFQGLELIMVLIGVIFWIYWHVWCIRWEKGYQEEKIRQHGTPENIKKALDEL